MTDTRMYADQDLYLEALALPDAVVEATTDQDPKLVRVTDPNRAEPAGVWTFAATHNGGWRLINFTINGIAVQGRYGHLADEHIATMNQIATEAFDLEVYVMKVVNDPCDSTKGLWALHRPDGTPKHYFGFSDQNTLFDATQRAMQMMAGWVKPRYTIDVGFTADDGCISGCSPTKATIYTSTHPINGGSNNG